MSIYDPHRREGALFADYVNTFLKLKAEASDYPGWVGIPEDEERYIEYFKAREGLLIDRYAIRSNAANWELGKIMFEIPLGKIG